MRQKVANYKRFRELINAWVDLAVELERAERTQAKAAMEIDRHHLPEDPAALQQMVIGLLEELEAKERRLKRVQHLLEQLLRWRYGQKRERVDENQLFLFAAGLVSAGQDQAPCPCRRTPRPHPRPPARRPSPSPRATAGSVCRNRSSGGAWSSTWASRSGTARSARAS